jgi:hypothetical protein
MLSSILVLEAFERKYWTLISSVVGGYLGVEGCSLRVIRCSFQILNVQYAVYTDEFYTSRTWYLHSQNMRYIPKNGVEFTFGACR